MNSDNEGLCNKAVQDIVVALDNLDGSEDSVVAAFKIFIEYKEFGSSLVDCWMEAIRDADPSDRLFLFFVAHHILLKANDIGEKDGYNDLLQQHLNEAVSLVCNIPSSREQVVKCLHLWTTRLVFPESFVRSLHSCTGEEDEVENNPSNRNMLSALNDPSNEQQPIIPSAIQDQQDPLQGLFRALSQNEAIISHVTEKLERDCHMTQLQGFTKYWKSPGDVLKTLQQEKNNGTSETSLVHLQKELEQIVLGLTLLDNAYEDFKPLQQAVRDEAQAQSKRLHENSSRFDDELDQCDTMDMQLDELDEHRKKYPKQWELRGQLVRLKKRKLDEEAARRAETLRKIQQESSAAFRKKKEAEEERERQRLAALEEEKRQVEAEERKRQESTLMYHPGLRQLVTRPDASADSYESWRDH